MREGALFVVVRIRNVLLQCNGTGSKRADGGCLLVGFCLLVGLCGSIPPEVEGHLASALRAQFMRGVEGAVTMWLLVALQAQLAQLGWKVEALPKFPSPATCFPGSLSRHRSPSLLQSPSLLSSVSLLPTDHGCSDGPCCACGHW